MAIDLQNLAQSGIKAIKKVGNEVKLLPAPKFDMPNDCYDGSILDSAGIERVMKKLDLLIAQTTQKLDEITKKYEFERSTRNVARGTRETQQELIHSRKVLRQLKEKKATLEANPKIIQDFLNEERKAPNTSFLFDPLLDASEKKAILAEHSEIIKISEMYTQFPQLKPAIMSEKFFAQKQFGEGQIYLDMSDPINAQNFLRLQNRRPATFAKVNSDTGLSVQDIRRYIANGFFEQISLIDSKTQAQVGIKAVDLASETTQKGLERLKTLNSFAPRVSKQVEDLRNQKKRVMVPISYLSKMGYGNNETIMQELSQGRIPTVAREVSLKTGGTKVVTYADVSNSKARDVLKYLRNQNNNLCSIEQMAKKAKVSVTEIEEAILSGEIKPIRDCLYTGDNLEITIDLADKSNAEFLERKLFEAELVKQNKNTETSIRSKLIWHFCPETKQAASEAFAKNKNALDTIRKEIADTNTALSNPALKPEEAEEFEEILAKLKEQEQIETRKSFGLMWSIAGKEEYDKAVEQAKTLIKQFKTQGIDSIEDEQVKLILKGAHQG